MPKRIRQLTEPSPSAGIGLLHRTEPFVQWIVASQATGRDTTVTFAVTQYPFKNPFYLFPCIADRAFQYSQLLAIASSRPLAFPEVISLLADVESFQSVCSPKLFFSRGTDDSHF